MINSVFECAEPCVWQGQNKVLFKRMLSTPQQPDYFLVVVRSSEVGHLDVGSPSWRSEGTLLISFSECRDKQEAMLLMQLQLVAHGSRQVRPQALHLLALECPASVGVCITYGAQCDIREAQFNSTNRAISRCCAKSCARNRDPLSIVSFTLLNHYERSRNSFHWRMRR